MILADFELIKEVYKRDDFSARPNMKPFCDLRPGYWVVDKENEGRVPGIVFAQGKSWNDQRRFTLRVLKDFGFGKTSMEDTIVEEVEKLCELLRKFEGQPLNLQFKLNVSIINGLWSLLVGVKLQLDNPRLLKIVELIDFVLRGQGTMGAIATMFPFPEMIRWPIISSLVGPDMEKNLKCFDELKLLIEEYIEDHKASLDVDNIRDFVDIYLVEIEKHQNDKESSFHQERGHYMLINTLIDLFVAGMETTSSSILWTFLLLLHHPEIKRKLLEEIDKVFIQIAVFLIESFFLQTICDICTEFNSVSGHRKRKGSTTQ